jgi:hypothetical protein
MQALGAYASLGLVKRNRAFLAYIRPALISLGELLDEMPRLKPLRASLAF